MDIKKMSKEDLEEMSMVDIAFQLMKDSKRTKIINQLFDQVSELQGLTETQKQNKIGDFYTNISTDKRFIVLGGSRVDLKTKHSVKKIKVNVDDEEDVENFVEEDEELDDEEAIEDEEDEYNSVVDDDDEDLLDDDEDDLKGLVILDEEDLDA